MGMRPQPGRRWGLIQVSFPSNSQPSHPYIFHDNQPHATLTNWTSLHPRTDTGTGKGQAWVLPFKVIPRKADANTYETEVHGARVEWEVLMERTKGEILPQWESPEISEPELGLHLTVYYEQGTRLGNSNCVPQNQKPLHDFFFTQVLLCLVFPYLGVSFTLHP